MSRYKICSHIYDMTTHIYEVLTVGLLNTQLEKTGPLSVIKIIHCPWGLLLDKPKLTYR